MTCRPTGATSRADIRRFARFDREFRRPPPELQRAFLDALPSFIAALRQRPPNFSPGLRVKRVQGHPGIWELRFAPDGRATFAYGEEQIPRRATHHLAADRRPLRAQRPLVTSLTARLV
jgi:hypothetical protein